MPDYEASLEQIYRRWIKPGDCAIDIGAHLGRHLGPMLDSVGSSGRIIAFEPLPFAFDALSAAYSAPNVTLLNQAVTRQPGIASFVYARGAPQESGLKARIFNDPKAADPEIIEVETVRIDDHTTGLQRISFIKIDVEGGEIDALWSAWRTIKTQRPLISVEYGAPTYSAYGLHRDDLYHASDNCGCVLYDLLGRRLSDISDWQAVCDGVLWDFLMVPRERESEYRQTMLGNPAIPIRVL